MLAALIAASLLLPVFVVTPVTAVEGNCVTNSDSHLHAGMENTTSKASQSRSGVSAIIDISGSAGAFEICNNGSLLVSVGPAAYVAIQPKFPTSTSQILQVGIIECLGPPIAASACQGENAPRFWWAYAGCLGDAPVPQDMGPANYAPHVYAIWLDTAGYWHIQIDGAAKGTAKHKILPHTYIACWANGNREADWSVERHNIGDSVGSPGSDRALFSQMRFGVYNEGWFNPNFYSGSTWGGCHYRDAADDVCGGYDYDNFWVYTAY